MSGQVHFIAHLRAAAFDRVRRDILWVLALMPSLLGPQDASFAQSTLANDQKVQLRLELQLLDAPRNGEPRQTVVTLQPLDWQSEAQNVPVSEAATTEVTLPPGRYQITSEEPVMVEGQPYGWDLEVPLTEQVNQVRLSQENAVRVSDTEPDQQTAVRAATPPNGTADHQAGTDPIVRAQVQDLLQRWTSSLRNRDLTEQMSCYASRLDAYFLRRNVSWNFVLRDKQRFLQRYPDVRHLSLSDVHISEINGRPEVTAVKTWSFGGRADWTGQVITHLQLEKQKGRWVIVSERERLVHESIPFQGISVGTAQ
jgi:hypothetical protein